MHFNFRYAHNINTTRHSIIESNWNECETLGAFHSSIENCLLCHLLCKPEQWLAMTIHIYFYGLLRQTKEKQ